MSEIGIPVFSVETLAKTNDSDKALIKIAVAVNFPALTSLEDKQRITKEAIKQLIIKLEQIKDGNDV